MKHKIMNLMMLGVSIGLGFPGAPRAAAQGAGGCETTQFFTRTAADLRAQTTSVTRGDFNGDGRLDLAAATRGRRIARRSPS